MSREIKRWGYLTFDRCEEILGGKASRKLGPNTYLSRKANDLFVVRFWGTDIIEWRKDGSVRLYNGGHRSTTTKQRLSSLSPVWVTQRSGEWWVGHRPFEDGMNVGKPQNDREAILLAVQTGDEVARMALADWDEERV